MSLSFTVRNNEYGQILLIVVLTMVVALTVGLAVASRIITDLRISKQNEESQRAFQAAEAGIQKSLQQNADVSSTWLDNNSTFEAGLSQVSGTSIQVNTGIDVDQNSGSDVWLSDHPTFSDPMNSQIEIYWGNEVENQDQCNRNASVPADQQDPRVASAIEVVVLQGPTSSPTLTKYFFEDIACSRGNSATPALAGGSVGGTDYRNRTSVIDITDGLVMKVIPVYNTTIIGARVVSGDPFPSQGKVVDSLGKSGATERKIKYFTSLPQLPIEVFPYSILSQ